MQHEKHKMPRELNTSCTSVKKWFVPYVATCNYMCIIIYHSHTTYAISLFTTLQGIINKGTYRK